MVPDTTASSYWLNWRVFLCALILLLPMSIAAFLIWKYEGFKKQELARRENQPQPPGTLYQDEVWKTCIKKLHPAWLLGFRIFSFIALTTLLVSNIIIHGSGIFYFYTQWTFTLVTFYFGFASAISIYGCNKYYKEDDRLSLETEQGTYRPPTIDEVADLPKNSNIREEESYVLKPAGIWVYTFQIVFQTCGGAVMLTDIVFWLLIYPFTEGYRLTFLDVAMHSLNAVFLLGDTALNSMRFPMFRIGYFALWSGVFVTYQWIIHACRSQGWPYQFLDLSTPYAPLWYLGVGVIHLPCYGFFALFIKLKNRWVSGSLPEHYQGLE